MLWAATGMGYTGHVPSAGNFTMLDFVHLPELRSTKKVRTLLMSLKVFHRSKYSQIANAARALRWTQLWKLTVPTGDTCTCT